MTDEIDGLGQRPHVREGRHAADGRMTRVDVEDGPAEPAFAQVPAQDLADRSRLVARADHGHGCGAQHGLDAFRSHGSSVLLGVRRTREC